MVQQKFIVPLAAAIVAASLAMTPAGAKTTSSHAASSHSSASHRSSGHAGPAATTTRKPLPAGTHFLRKSCKTASCKAKHPGGSYMVPIKPRKGGRAA